MGLPKPGSKWRQFEWSHDPLWKIASKYFHGARQGFLKKVLAFTGTIVGLTERGFYSIRHYAA